MSAVTVQKKHVPAVQFDISLVLPVTVKSEMNARDHWAARKRRFDQQADALFKAIDALGWYSTTTGYCWPFGFPVAVTFTRYYARGKRMDDDNIRAAFKALRDAVAEWAGVDDGADQIEWKYEQDEFPRAGVEVRIEGRR